MKLVQKSFVIVLFFFLFCPIRFFGQNAEQNTKEEAHQDSLSVLSPDSLLSDSLKVVPDSLLAAKRSASDSILSFARQHVQASISKIDTTRAVNYWRITERTGEMITAHPDTFLTDYFHRTNVEGQGVAMAYLGNLGLPGESRIFFERKDRSQFMFRDAYDAYLKTPGNFNFINTKIPHSNLSYQRAGDRLVMEERLQALLTLNVGKKLNVGFNADYLYARGYYNSQSSKHLDWIFFGSYLSNHHQLHVFFHPSDYTNAENGGITDPEYITHPEYLDSRNISSREIPTQLSNTWNRLRGKQFYANYRYNLGFERENKNENESAEDTSQVAKQFVPVASFIYTLNYEDRKKNFYTSSPQLLATYYKNNTDFMPNASSANDSTSYWSLSNTAALSLREGFSEWAKFDLTAFLTQDFRHFALMDTLPTNQTANQTATYIGGEMSSLSGKFFRYDAQGSFGLLGYNLGDLNLSGNLETRIPLWGDTASIRASASIKNLAPTYYENHYRSRYFWWDNDFKKVKKVFIGGLVDIPHTKTQFNLGVENVTYYIYFDEKGIPQQHNSNIQILSLRLDQNFAFKALHWDNQVVYQTSSDPKIIPLPDLAAYSSLYIQFKISKVLTIQMGTNAHYWTKYYAPAYEPAILQFKLQQEAKIGNYPLMSAFLNCHLKQTRFFIEYYNASAKLISPPEYFSLPNYPVNPTIIKLGLSVDFIN